MNFALKMIYSLVENDGFCIKNDDCNANLKAAIAKEDGRKMISNSEFVYTCRRLIDLSMLQVTCLSVGYVLDAVCFVYTCRRLIDLSLLAGAI